MAAETTFDAGDGLNPMEARILAWVCGEASPSEAEELERLSAAHPEWAALRSQLQGAGDLVAAAAAAEREPLRLSPRRRRRLLRNLMPRKNLMISAAMAVSLIAGVAVYGERTHYVPPARVSAGTEPPPVFVIPTPEPEPVDEPVTPRSHETDSLPNPQQPDVPPVVVPDSAFTQAIEPPPISGPTNLDHIGDGDGLDHRPSRPFNLSELDTSPVARYQARADYPYAMRERGISGEVLVEFIVDPKGDVHNVTVVRSTERAFEESASRAVAKWKFRPGRKGGIPVFVRMQLPVVFTLDAGGP